MYSSSGKSRLLVDELQALEVEEVGFQLLPHPGDGLQDAEGEVPADHRGHLHDPLQVLLQPVHPGGDDPLDGVGNGHFRKLVRTVYILTKKFSEMSVSDTKGSSPLGHGSAGGNAQADHAGRLGDGSRLHSRILQAISGMQEELKSHSAISRAWSSSTKTALPGAEDIFKHALIQEVAYRASLLKRRKEIHERSVGHRADLRRKATESSMKRWRITSSGQDSRQGGELSPTGRREGRRLSANEEAIATSIVAWTPPLPNPESGMSRNSPCDSACLPHLIATRGWDCPGNAKLPPGPGAVPADRRNPQSLPRCLPSVHYGCRETGSAPTSPGKNTLSLARHRLRQFLGPLGLRGNHYFTWENSPAALTHLEQMIVSMIRRSTTT